MMDAPLPPELDRHWEKFLSAERTLDDLFSHPVLFPLQRRVEMETMLGLCMGRVPHTLVDIGTDKGGGLWAWCKHLPTLKRVIACEIRGLPYRKQFTEAFPHISFLWLPCSSYESWVVDTVRDWLDSVPIDILWLDGDKSRFDTDFRLYSHYTAKGGVCLMHDVSDAAPGEAFRSCRVNRMWTIIEDRSDTEAALAREEAGVEATCPHEGWLRHWRGRSCTVGVIYL